MKNLILNLSVNGGTQLTGGAAGDTVGNFVPILNANTPRVCSKLLLQVLVGLISKVFAYFGVIYANKSVLPILTY